MPADASTPDPPSARPPVRALLVTAAGGCGPLAEAVFEASGGAVALVESIGSAAAMRRLGDELFDAVLVHDSGHHKGHHALPGLDAVEFCRAARGAGHDHALVVLGEATPGQMDSACAAAGADAYCCLAQSTAASLLAVTRRAIDHARLAREHHRLADAERRRLANDHREAELLLAEQRRMVEQLENLVGDSFTPLPSASTDNPASQESAPPADIADRYRDLLQAYVIMGAGNLTDEMTGLARRLIEAGVTGRGAVAMHVRVLEAAVAGLGARSARHVMNRGDLLLVELMVHLADGYRERYDARPATTRRAPTPPPADAPDKLSGPPRAA